MKNVLFSLSAAALLLIVDLTGLAAQDRLSGELFATRSEVIAKNGMAATNHPLAGQIALDILKKGGSAVDAAIAANAFLSFADPAMNGPGGDLFAIVWSADDRQLHGLNASGRSPQNLTIDYFREQGIESISASSPHAVTVPGAVDGWVELHNKFGSLEFEELFAPTIQYAREGIGMTAEIADLMDYLERDLIRGYGLGDDFEWDDLDYFSSLYRPEGRFPQKGELHKNPDLAETLELIARGGRDAFYEGDIAEVITTHIQEMGGFLTMEDFAAHRSEWVDPVSVSYRGVDVWQLPPNVQGMSVLQMLNILEGFDMAEYGFGSPEHIHYFTEAKKLAYADMATWYGDPDFSDLPIDQMLSKEYADSRREKISDKWTGSYGTGIEGESHTIYLTVADGDGNMISLIQSNSWLFGSLITPPGLGFPLQNRGTGFTLEEGHVNTYEPEKRPFHTIIPAFVTKDDEPYISFGLTGGDMQPQGHVQIVMNVIDFGMNLQEASDAPRIRHSGSGEGFIQLESGFQYESVRELLKMGHQVRYGFESFGGFQGIMFDGTFYYGASESRKDGQAVGY
ncbi:MAG: gamma-glutamyltransferase [Balneolaceae bacterium]|nr:gamma-glutamyltransferase [Balneolaceae bacterium]MCH8550079.1 gamma-glutamyltransferase [Balneolaceae bacterium]